MSRGNGSVPGGGGKSRVLLAIFGFPLLLDGFRAVIDSEPDMAVVGSADDADDLPSAIARMAPDVVVTECLALDGQGPTTVQTIETIRSVNPTVKVLALACRTSSEQFSLALRAGADGFLAREAQGADVVDAIRCVGRGQTYVSPSIVTRMVETYIHRSPQRGIEDPYDALNDREHEILLLAAVGHTNREIAKTLHLSEQTVHNYRAGMMEKLGVHDRVELLKYAIRRGVISVADL